MGCGGGGGGGGGDGRGECAGGTGYMMVGVGVAHSNGGSVAGSLCGHLRVGGFIDSRFFRFIFKRYPSINGVNPASSIVSGYSWWDIGCFRFISFKRRTRGSLCRRILSEA